jgi:starch phosphorylase
MKFGMHIKTKKKKLIDYVHQSTGHSLNKDSFILGFARRQTAYKRPDLLFRDINELKRINKIYPLHIVYAGKAHPKDSEGKEIIQRIIQLSNDLQGELQIIFLENYSIDVAKRLIAGVDLWINTPEKSLEASGTSGMKAALNGIPQLSVLDG